MSVHVISVLPDHQAEEQKLWHFLLCTGIFEPVVDVLFIDY